MATKAATAMIEFQRILKFNLLSRQRLRPRVVSGEAILRAVWCQDAVAGNSPDTIFPQIVLLTNIFLNLAIWIPGDIEADLPRRRVRARIVDRRLVMKRK